jgi:hypothetical protein
MVQQIAVGDYAEEIKGMFGKHLWVPMTAAIKTSLARHIPSKQKKEKSYAKVLELAMGFEGHAAELGVAPPAGSAGATVLSDHVGEVGVARDKSLLREELLEEAREILAPCSGRSYNMVNKVEVEHQTERGGLFPDEPDGGEGSLDESIYRLPKCQISVPTQSLVDFAYKRLDEMSEGSPEDAVVTFNGVRDAFDMFRAIVPTRNHDALSELYPELCAIFHNDCFYIAHHLLTLGKQFGKALPEAYWPSATFVDMVPMFQDLGEKYFVTMLQSQRRQLLGKLQKDGGFSLAGQDEARRDERLKVVTVTITVVLNDLQRLADLWRRVLPASIFERSLGVLADSVMATLISEVLRLEDLVGGEANQLHDLFSRFKTASLFGVDTIEAVPVGRIPSLARFNQMVSVLSPDIRLSDIEQKWKDGEFVLEADELRHMIRALFSNGEKRARVLALIK